MKTLWPVLAFVILVVIIVGVVIFTKKDNKSADSGTTTNTVTSNTTATEAPTDTSGIDATALAKYLTSKGIKFYGASWCPHCQDQKKLFGDAMQYVTYIECSPNGSSSPQADVCTAAGVESYPTWIINGQKHTGLQTFSELATLSGFQP